jgi:hypothetical protein
MHLPHGSTNRVPGLDETKVNPATPTYYLAEIVASPAISSAN